MIFLARALAVLGVTGACGAALLAPADAGAQQIYRSVGPQGQVTFSDRPPADANARPTTAAVTVGSGDGDAGSLPFALRQAVQAYPVTLFSGPECAPCDQARSMLKARGIPFSEKTVSTNEDIDALKRLIGMATLPVMTIGSQQLKGYAQVEWTEYLDAAGYPKTSQLPAGYQPPPPTPLVAVHEVKPPPRQATARIEPVTPPPPPPADSGFQF